MLESRNSGLALVDFSSSRLVGRRIAVCGVARGLVPLGLEI